MTVYIYPSFATLHATYTTIPLHIHLYDKIEHPKYGKLPNSSCTSKFQKSKLFGKSIITGLRILKQQRLSFIMTVEILGKSYEIASNESNCFKQDIKVDTTIAIGTEILIKATYLGIIYKGTCQVVKDQGIAVISDIDDTMRIADGFDLFELLRSSFYYNYTPVDGMTELFAKWKLKYNCRFYYVTASPDQLFPEFDLFCATYHFPFGYYVGKHFRWYYDDAQVSHEHTIDYLMPNESMVQVTDLQDNFDSKYTNETPEQLQNIMMDGNSKFLIYNHKYLSIFEIVSKQPNTKFILIGDDTAHDAFIFSKIKDHFPDQILHIYVRHVIKNQHLSNSDKKSPKEYNNLEHAKKVLIGTEHTIFTKVSELMS